MRNRRKRRNRKRNTIRSLCMLLPVGVLTAGAVVYVAGRPGRNAERITPKELLPVYMSYISQKEYDAMYEMLDPEASGNISQEDFVSRNSAIYEGIGMQNLEIEVLSYEAEREVVAYRTSFDTSAGSVSFENEAFFTEGEDGYRLIWEDALIFPELGPADKVRVSVIQADRGEILDRNGKTLAGTGTASSVGIVPGKLNDRDSAIQEAAELLETEPEFIEKKLSAKWVRDDSFVPIRTIPKVPDIEYLIPLEPDEEMERENERQERLLQIPGIMISDTEVRSYPYKEAASHLIGYVQSVTAEDLEQHAGEGYTAGSVIGRNGMEGLFEKELKGENGCRIWIADSEGKEKKEVADRLVRHGQDIRLTIDADLQSVLYEQFQEDKSCSIAMDPGTGEVLALVSTPSYDSNDFIMGLSEEQWTMLNEDERKPLYNRFRQVWCPGSVFKPVIAAIGLDCGAIDPVEDYGNEGLSWQKDASWGSYHVTTLHAYDPVILDSALIYSDNIYFAKAALKIGTEELETSLQKLGFQQEFPFAIRMQSSSYSNTEKIESEIQLADSGYGQGQILVNPLHLACIYTAFYNEGNVVKPYLVRQQDPSSEYWLLNAFSAETAKRVLEGMKKVISDPGGTAYTAYRAEPVLAGKTGTAEIKDSKEDTSGTEIGWFAVLTADQDAERPLLLVSMVEDVKGRGGSGYVVEKDREVLERWFDRIP